MAKKRKPKAPPREPPPLTADTPLSPMENAFVSEYLIDHCAGRAYRAVNPGCTRKSAFELGSRLLRKVNVRAEIDAELREQRRRSRVSVTSVVREASRLLFADIADCYDSSDDPLPARQIPLHTRRAVQSRLVKTRREVSGQGKKRRVVEESISSLRLNSKAEALGKLFKHLGLETEITPIEALLQMLPRELAIQLRTALLMPKSNGKPAGRPPAQ